MTTLFSLVIALVLIGLFLYLVKFIPMDPTIAKILQVVVVVLVVLWLISVLFGGGTGFSIPQIQVK